MRTIAFPPQSLTDEDGRSIDRLLRRGGVGTRHGIHLVSDARGRGTLRTRRADEVLRVVAP